MSLYPVASRAADGFAEDGEVPGGGLVVAFRLEDVASPLRKGGRSGPGTGRRWSSGGRRGSARAR